MTQLTVQSELPKENKFSKGRYFLSIENIPTALSSFPAYYVGSTAPNNVEDGIGEVPNPSEKIAEIASFLAAPGNQNPQMLITVHGYNTAMGWFTPEDSLINDTNQPLGGGTKGWYQEIRTHIEQHCAQGSEGLAFVGYRWPSEQVSGDGDDSLQNKLINARQSLPSALNIFATVAIALFSIITLCSIILSLVMLKQGLSTSIVFGIVAIICLILATGIISIVGTLFLLRIVGYFRDSYRASNYGVPDLVEFVRQLDKAVLDANPERDWSTNRVKLSFIGHSMGGFVVTNAVRILSDVFDDKSIGNLDSAGTEKAPSSDIGRTFSLERLVLVSPDIPVEAIISGRGNFLSSSLRRFQEAYLFSNEGDMALKLASTAANYGSFPARTREGGYRLGNVVIRERKSEDSQTKDKNSKVEYGIINYDVNATQDKAYAGKESPFLEYLYILSDKTLSERQHRLLKGDKQETEKPTTEKPTTERHLASRFTFFDCTDYIETAPHHSNQRNQKVGVLSRALGKRSLTFIDYLLLTIDYFSGKIDTHGGYFNSGFTQENEKSKPEAGLTKQLIYGLACLGFDSLLASLAANEPQTENTSDSDLKVLHKRCQDSQIQVLLSSDRLK